MKNILLALLLITANFAAAETITCIGKTNDENTTQLDFELVIAKKDKCG